MTTNYVEPTASNLSFAEISRLAEQFASEVKFTPESDLSAIVENLGGEISYEDFWDLEKSDSGSIRVESEGKFKITLPNHTAQTRDRFTIGHELGHWLLHFLYPKSQATFPQGCGMEARRFGSGQTETEANWFSAALLMPSSLFRDIFHKSNGDIELVASHFSVSTSAAAVRAKVLNLG